ncbi:MAG: tRNA (adenosine(37)-N6)-threonylcarbamoyltransferase complex ATPase subunit type 1 TsaE [Coriobacteriales bacterium]|jgi:tRNA threonylcarbamoyladenosine biosynthesis protein TsaE
MEKLTSTSVEETLEIGRAFGEKLRPGDVVSLVGDLGAGKTHFAKGVALGLGIEEPVTSPTFNILRLYDGRYVDEAGAGHPLQLAHWDLYRLEEEAQLDDIDFFGILESGCASLVEWADKFPGILPDEATIITIRVIDENTREITIE